jgi:hypothetical protein
LANLLCECSLHNTFPYGGHSMGEIVWQNNYSIIYLG